MDKELIKDFTRRVSQASKTELIVIMYDIILADASTAKEALERADIEAFRHDVKHAQRFVSELMAVLNLSISLSHELFSLYTFVNKSLINAYYRKDGRCIDEAVMVIEKLRSAFAEISQSDNSGPVMKNTQQLYAGLTYGRGTLNEAYIDPNAATRGYKC